MNSNKTSNKPAMLDFFKFDCEKRLDPHLTKNNVPDVFKDRLIPSYSVVGTFSYEIVKKQQVFEYNKPCLEETVTYSVVIPNRFVTIGPNIPRYFLLKLDISDPVFKAGILHDYLLFKKIIKQDGVGIAIEPSVAREVFVSAMKDLGVGYFRRNFYSLLSRFSIGCNSITF